MEALKPFEEADSKLKEAVDRVGDTVDKIEGKEKVQNAANALVDTLKCSVEILGGAGV